MTPEEKIARNIKVKASLQARREQGLPLGRPMKRDDKKIRELRAQGLSLRAIGKLVGVSATTVQSSLRQGEST